MAKPEGIANKKEEKENKNEVLLQSVMSRGMKVIIAVK
jgi:hypothetical protein